MFLPLTHSGLEIKNDALHGGSRCFLPELLATKGRLKFESYLCLYESMYSFNFKRLKKGKMDSQMWSNNIGGNGWWIDVADLKLDYNN